MGNTLNRGHRLHFFPLLSLVAPPPRDDERSEESLGGGVGQAPQSPLAKVHFPVSLALAFEPYLHPAQRFADEAQPSLPLDLPGPAHPSHTVVRLVRGHLHPPRIASTRRLIRLRRRAH